jgi:uncharacterized membrane protein YciS (DUF1049 family)
MAFAKWTVVFLLSFALAFVIIVTFSQAPFRQTVPAVLFTYHTKALPIYIYVGSALCLGLLVGFSVAAYYFVALKTALYKKDRQIKKMEDDLDLAKAAPKQIEVRYSSSNDEAL